MIRPGREIATSNSTSGVLPPPSLTELAGVAPPGAAGDVRTRRLGVLILSFVAVLTLATGLLFFVPGIPFVVLATDLDYIVNTAAMLLAGAVAVLAWIRSRETNEPDAPYQASAFLVLFLGGGIAIVLLVSGIAFDAGFDRTAPGQAPLYMWTVQRLLAAGLLLGGAAAALGRRPPGFRRAAMIVTVPAVTLLGLTALVLIARAELPVLVPPDHLATMTAAVDRLDPWILTAPLTIAQLALAALFLVAAGAYLVVYRRQGGRRTYLAYLSVALVVAAFSQVHFAVVPGAYSDLLTSGDVLRLAFYVLLGLGLVAGWRQDLHELKEANENLIRLRAVDAERVALEERARLARDVHDGLVQEIWLARLTHGQLLRELERGAKPLSDAMAAAARRLDSILDDALAEARQAVVTLQPPETDGFGGMLSRSVEDYGDRFGLAVECTVAPETIDLSSRHQGEIIRICREALNNARKHANASLVRVDLESRPDCLRLRVSDDGIGFDPTELRRGYGLRSMLDRAGALGGSLHIDSAPGRGTRVTFDLPLDER